MKYMDEKHSDAAGRAVSAVIFDMDGIIFDTERLYVECWIDAGKEYDLADIEQVSCQMIGVNDILTRKIFNDQYQGTRDYDVCRKRVSVLLHYRYDGKIPLKRGVREILAFLESVYRLVDHHVERFIERDFSHLQVAFGCTGGQHRSVYCAEPLAQHLQAKYGIEIHLIHRERGIDKCVR